MDNKTVNDILNEIIKKIIKEDCEKCLCGRGSYNCMLCKTQEHIKLIELKIT